MWKRQYLKYKEWLRRRVQAIPHRVYAFGLLLSCMLATQLLVHQKMHIVYVTDSDGACTMVTSGTTDPDTLMKMANQEAEQWDRISYVDYTENRSNLNIQRAFPVQVSADGETQEVMMIEGTVQDALEQAGVVLEEHDYTVPSLYAPVTKDSEIEVNRVTYVDTVEYETVPFETVYTYTSQFHAKRRKTIVRQEGQEGKLQITNRERWVNGELESAQEVGRKTLIQPKNEIVRAYKAGAPVSPLTGPDGTTDPPKSYQAVYHGKATGYHSKQGGRGASRLGLRYGTVAVDPALIPYGTLLYITSPGGKFVYGYAIATDTGEALQQGEALVDLYYETPEEAILNGVQAVDVYVVK